MIIGGVRGEEDEKLVRDIRDLCKYLSVEDNVEVRIIDQFCSEHEYFKVYDRKNTISNLYISLSRPEKMLIKFWRPPKMWLI